MPGRTAQAGGHAATRALSRAQVTKIVENFQALNPYDHNTIPDSILKIEDVNFARVKPGSEKVARTRPLQLYAYAISRTQALRAVQRRRRPPRHPRLQRTRTRLSPQPDRPRRQPARQLDLRPVGLHLNQA